MPDIIKTYAYYKALANILKVKNISPYTFIKKQVKFPRSKKKRIRKKWAKQEKNFSLFPSSLVLYSELVSNPTIIEKLKSKIKE